MNGDRRGAHDSAEILQWVDSERSLKLALPLQPNQCDGQHYAGSELMPAWVERSPFLKIESR